MVLADLRLCSLFPFHTHNLNHVSVFLYLCLSCVSLACPTLVAPSPYLVLVCWLINIRDSVFCPFDFSVLCTNRFSFLVRDRQKTFSPPRVLSPIVSFFTFYPTLHLPDFLQPACFSACLLLLRVSLCPSGTARVSLSVWVGLKGSLCLFATPQREGRQVSNTKPSAPYTGRGTSTGP